MGRSPDAEDRGARALTDRGFALRRVQDAGPFRLPARPALGLWHQDEGTGTLICPVAGRLALPPGALVLHDCGAETRGEQPPGGRAFQVELGPGLLREVALMEFGVGVPDAPGRGARRLDDPTLAEMARTMWHLGTGDGAGASGASPPAPAAAAAGTPGAGGDGATLLALARALATRLLGHHLIAPDRRRLDARLALVLDHVEAHLDETLRLRALADVAGLSIYHFSRVFSEHVGVSVQAHVRRRRLARARRLLAGGDLPLAEIAYACGFAHQSHFTATFRAATGETPGAYRQRLRGGGADG